MKFLLNLDKYKIESYTRGDGSFVLFDPVRKKLVQYTPEEEVRQKFIQYLVHELHVPIEQIEVEKPLTHTRKGEKGRADIVVYSQFQKEQNSDADACEFPVLVVECKSSKIELNNATITQVVDYNWILDARTIGVTNGLEAEFRVWDYNRNEYMIATKIPNFYDLQFFENWDVHLVPPVYFQHIAFSPFYTKGELIPYYDGILINSNSPDYVQFLCVNLLRLLFHQGEEPLFLPQSFSGVNIIEDKLCPYRSYGNASGGKWWGSYRSLLVDSGDARPKLVEISILSCQANYTVLIVAISDELRVHNSLQLNLDRCTRKLEDGSVEIFHDGKIAVGNLGAAPNKEVLAFVEQVYPELKPDGRFLSLGKLNLNYPLSMQDESVLNFFHRLILYSIARDKFRDMWLEHKRGHDR